MLASYWWPNLNPIGPASLWPLGIVIAYALFTWATRWRALLFAAPGLFALGAAFYWVAVLPWRSCPDADAYVGYYILSMTAIVFALEVARSGSRVDLVYGGLILFPLGGLLTLEIVARSSQLVRATRDLPFHLLLLSATVVWVVVFGILILRAARVARERRRRAQGLCTKCVLRPHRQRQRAVSGMRDKRAKRREDMNAPVGLRMGLLGTGLALALSAPGCPARQTGRMDAAGGKRRGAWRRCPRVWLRSTRG
jgi:hypothetical protein